MWEQGQGSPHAGRGRVGCLLEQKRGRLHARAEAVYWCVSGCALLMMQEGVLPPSREGLMHWWSQ